MSEELAPYTVAKIKAEKIDEGFELAEMNEIDVKNDPKANVILEKLIKPETIEDSVIGELYLDKKKYTYSRTIVHTVTAPFTPTQQFQVLITLPGGEEVATARSIVQRLDELVPEAIEYASEKLDEEVKEPEYMWIRGLNVLHNGDFSFRFEYEPQ